MKNRQRATWLGLLLLLLASAFLFTGCRLLEPSIRHTLYLGDYVFRVEEVVGDLYNVRTRYSLQRRDGEPIDPELRFQELVTAIPGRHGGSVQYTPSADGKTLWIEERKSCASRQKASPVYTLTLENLFSYESGERVQTGMWRTAYRAHLTREAKTLRVSDCTVPAPGTENLYYEITDIRLSPVGLHMEFQVPTLDIKRVASNLSLCLMLEEGEVMPLRDLHVSLSGTQGDRLHRGSCSVMYDKTLPLDTLRQLIVCGQAIPIDGIL